MMAPVSRARTSAPITFGFDVTRARVVSRSALLREGDNIGIDMAMWWMRLKQLRIWWRQRPAIPILVAGL